MILLSACVLPIPWKWLTYTRINLEVVNDYYPRIPTVTGRKDCAFRGSLACSSPCRLPCVKSCRDLLTGWASARKSADFGRRDLRHGVYLQLRPSSRAKGEIHGARHQAARACAGSGAPLNQFYSSCICRKCETGCSGQPKIVQP